MGDGGNGSMTIRPLTIFDREGAPGKVLEVPLILSDKAGKTNHESVFVIIGDQVRSSPPQLPGIWHGSRALRAGSFFSSKGIQLIPEGRRRRSPMGCLSSHFAEGGLSPRGVSRRECMSREETGHSFIYDPHLFLLLSDFLCRRQKGHRRVAGDGAFSYLIDWRRRAQSE